MKAANGHYVYSKFSANKKICKGFFFIVGRKLPLDTI